MSDPTETKANDRHFVEYLAALAARLDGAPSDNARAVDEIAAHLHDVADAEIAAGHDAATAATRALARIGSVEAVAARFAHEVDGQWTARILLRLVRVAAAALFALGVGSLLAWPVSRLFSRGFFVLDEGWRHPTPAQCHALMARYGVGDCHAALLAGHVRQLAWLGLVVAVAAALTWWALGAALARLEPLRGRARLDRWTARGTLVACYVTALYLVTPGEGALCFIIGVVVDLVAIGYVIRARSVRRVRS